MAVVKLRLLFNSNLYVMKRLFKTNLSVLVLLLLAAPLFAQPGRGNDARPGPHHPERFMEKVPAEVRTDAQIAVFDEYLDLSAEQEQQIRDTEAAFAEKAEAIREEKVLRHKKMDMMRELKKEHQLAIHEILTKEQYSVFLEKREAIQFDIRQRLKEFTDK